MVKPIEKMNFNGHLKGLGLSSFLFMIEIQN